VNTNAREAWVAPAAGRLEVARAAVGNTECGSAADAATGGRVGCVAAGVGRSEAGGGENVGWGANAEDTDESGTSTGAGKEATAGASWRTSDELAAGGTNAVETKAAGAAERTDAVGGATGAVAADAGSKTEDNWADVVANRTGAACTAEEGNAPSGGAGELNAACAAEEANAAGAENKANEGWVAPIADRAGSGHAAGKEEAAGEADQTGAGKVAVGALPLGKAEEEAMEEFSRVEGGRVVGSSALIRRLGAEEAPEVPSIQRKEREKDNRSSSSLDNYLQRQLINVIFAGYLSYEFTQSARGRALLRELQQRAART
jgi:hypothetical protein